MTDTAIIITNWNGKKYLQECLDSLFQQTYPHFIIYFVDNGSTDGSVKFLENNYIRRNVPKLEIIELKKNTGFCFANNTGIRRALENEKIKYVVVLNNDTKLKENYLEELIACAERHRYGGAIQPKVLKYFERDIIDCAGIYLTADGSAHNRGHGKNSSQYDAEKRIFGANGTASLFSREALEKTRIAYDEFFDNFYFAYYEDTDLAFRLLYAGYEAIYCPKAVAYHFHSGTGGEFSLMKAYYLHRNYLLTVFKNLPSGIIYKALGRRLLEYFWLFYAFFRKDNNQKNSKKNYGKGKLILVVFESLASAFWHIPQIINKRKMIKQMITIPPDEVRLWLNQKQDT